ncbi:MAG TPA: hypothetical protein VH599_05165 [Ktedonobacterales bacterium]|jgi:hypothetical protein
MGPQDASDRIWLKQSVQFSVAGQVRTIEIALPVRPDASAEEIERLLRQADAGLDQMTQHLNSKVNKLLDQGKTQKTPVAADSSRRNPRDMRGLEESASAVEGSGAGARPTGSGAPPTMAGAVSEGADWSAPGPTEALPAAGSALDRKQFIAEIAVLGLNPRQAMERLGVRTLDGVNLRQALEQLRLQLLHERPASTGARAAVEDSGSSSAEGSLTRGVSSPPASGSPHRQAPELKYTSLLSQAAPVEQTILRPLPEGGLLIGDEEQPSADVAAQERNEHLRVRERPRTPIPIRGERNLNSLQEQARARTLLERLRRLRGRLNPPSSDNLKAFRYVVEDQIGAEKTAALLQAIWSVSLPERLSPDQVAECIRWGKDDHFEEEVDMLLRLTAAEES